MTVKETELKDCFILEPEVFLDKRGGFIESYNKRVFYELTGQKIDFVQDNESFSKRGVLRGLHFQKGEYAQAKLVRVITGRILDVVVDLREDSSSFGKCFSTELSEENKKQLFIPRGFAHGFVVLSNTVLFSYKCDNFYNRESESGIVYNDKVLNIDWKLPENEFIVSNKDLVLPTFNDLFK
ncbi:dTDP-4-dehydrorhamnose 3,5-epimerase [Algibacter lectus]|uniref:dTDP-4-dehydrorhamnose 3,5-epimerase n=1 Tax=Algibacter lectus TaxID=221126 RepID=UPI0026EC378E|nr:dTDP-4-dehydrorhamnose 3,5-epimerase [Algibacter lectus]MDO7137102.1 dTDP-4-dehydrorhamnose 3,5-epimerase [Algibacter lectus]